MPDLRGREKYENELAAALLLSWDDAVNTALTGAEPDWDRLKASIKAESAASLHATALAAALMLMQELSGTRRLPAGFDVSNGQPEALARGLVSTRRAEWKSTPDPQAWVDRWMSRDAAKSIAITEVTTAVGHGEAKLRSEFETLGVKLVAIWNIDPRSNVCKICLALDGEPEDVWEKEFPGGPPAHPACILGETPVWPASLVAIWRAKYNGPAVRIEFTDGSTLRVTPNHMLLTPEGFIPARFIQDGDDILSCPAVEMPLATPADSGPDDKHHPPTVEEVFGAFAVSGGMSVSSMPLSPEDFHGDGVGCDGQVDVVRPNGKLRGDDLVQFLKPPLHRNFKRATVGHGDFAGLRDLATVLDSVRLATDGGVGSIRERKAITLGHSRVPEVVSLGSGPDREVHRLESACQCAAADAHRLRNVKEAFPSLVSTAKVVKVNVEHVSTYVYDLETEESVYTVGAHIISSNCACFLTYRPA